MTDAPPPRPRRRRRWLLYFILLLILIAVAVAVVLHLRKDASPATSAGAEQGAGGGAAGGKGRHGKGKGGPNGPVPVTIGEVKAADVPVVLTALGTVQASNTVTISPMVTGPITAINFTEGQDVKAGDVLAQIDPRTYQATLDQDTGKLHQDQATLAGAQRDLARFNQLAVNSYTPKQTADDQRATVAETKALVEQDQAAIENAKTELSYTTITAPVDGRVGIRTIDLGNIVAAGSSTGIVTLTTLKPIAVVFTLPQQNLPAIQDAMAAGKPAVSVDGEGSAKAGDNADSGSGAIAAVDAAAAKPEYGTLSVVDNQVDSSTGTVKLKAYFPNEDLHLWPGGFVTAHLTVKTLKGVLTVPPVAVQQGPKGNYVYVVGADKKVTQRTVTVTQQDETTAVIATGVAAGEQVILQGASQVSDGSKVRIVTADAKGKTGTTATGDTTAPAGQTTGGAANGGQGGNSQ